MMIDRSSVGHWTVAQFRRDESRAVEFRAVDKEGVTQSNS